MQDHGAACVAIGLRQQSSPLSPKILQLTRWQSCLFPNGDAQFQFAPSCSLASYPAPCSELKHLLPPAAALGPIMAESQERHKSEILDGGWVRVRVEGGHHHLCTDIHTRRHRPPAHEAFFFFCSCVVFFLTVSKNKRYTENPPLPA